MDRPPRGQRGSGSGAQRAESRRGEVFLWQPGRRCHAAPAGTVPAAAPATVCLGWGRLRERSPSLLTSRLQKAHLGMAETSLTFRGRRSWVGGESWQSCFVRGEKKKERNKIQEQAFITRKPHCPEAQTERAGRPLS